MTWKSTSQDQQEILSAIEALHVPDGFEADCTYGNGDAARLRGLIRDAESTDGRCPWCDDHLGSMDRWHYPDCPAFSSRDEVRR